jgi:hypothetical protein
LLDGEIDGVGLSPHYGFTGDATLLNRLPSFAGIVHTDAGSFDCRTLPLLNSLRFISLGGVRPQGTDFSDLSKLVDLRIGWNRSDLLPSPDGALESLYLKGYNPKSKDISGLPAFANLATLELVQAGITSLKGVERLKMIRELDASYCKGLATVQALVSTTVERVHFEGCGRITDIPALAKCPQLRSVRLSSCGNLKSLGFLKDSRTIEEFRFVKMEVDDCDMTPLLALKSVGFIDRRGYSHTNAQVTQLITKRMTDAPDSKKTLGSQ